MQSQSPDKSKGLSIFQRLFISHMTLGLFIVVIFGFLYYTREKENIKEELKSEFSYSLENAVNYFDKVYKTKIQGDLASLGTSYAFNTYLSSSNEDIIFTKSLANGLFLNFTRNPNGIYLSARFIDAQGNEKIITQGNRRMRNYATSGNLPGEKFYSHLNILFQRLKSAQLGAILFEGPFQYKDKMTFLAGRSMGDPEVGGFAGAVIFHCDLTDYFNYLNNQVFEKEHIAQAVTLNNELIFAPADENILSKNSYNFHSDSRTIRMGWDNQGLFKVKFFVSSHILDDHLHEIFKYFILWIFLSILPISSAAFFVSRHFSRPLISLVSYVGRLAKGDLSIRANVKATGEIKVLTESLNNLAEDLYNTKVSREKFVEEVAEREKIEKEKLEQSVYNLKKFNQAAVNREERMIELKLKVNELLEELGREPLYDFSFLRKKEEI